MNQKIFSIFRFLLLILPAIFLLYLFRFWFWFLYPLPTNVLEFTTGVLFIFWIFGIIWLEFPKPKLSKWQLFAILFFLFAATLATAVTVFKLPLGRTVPLGIWKGWFIAPFLYFLMLISSFRTRYELMLLIDIALGIISLTAALMVLQYFTGFFSDIVSTVDHRLVWPYLDPLSGKGTSGNYPALFLSPFFCLGLMNFFHRKKKLDKLYSLLAIIPIGIAIYLSKSYGAWLAIIGACALGSFMIFSGKKRWILVPLITALVIFGLYLDQKNTEKFRFGLNLNKQSGISSSEERKNIWKVSIDLIKRDPIFGVGPGQFQRGFERQATFTLLRGVSRQEINHALHTHNTFLMFLVSNGIFGLLSFIILIFAWMIPVQKPLRFLFWIPMFAYLFHGVIDVFYWKNDLAYNFWFLGALMTIAKHSNVITGTVKKGLGIGNELGFPTANVRLQLKPDKPFGVYVVNVFLDRVQKKGLLYYGPRKTKGLPENIVCEMTILNFEKNLYGKKISFEIETFIRSPKSFSSFEELKKQIEKDILIAKYRKLI